MPVEAGGRGLAPSEVSRLTIYQAYLFLAGRDCEWFENNRLRDKHWDAAEADRDLLDEMRAIPQFSAAYPTEMDGKTLAEINRERMKELRRKFTGSEEIE